MDQWMMLSLPNSGSTWLGKLLGKHSRILNYYDKEFFSPNCNPMHRERIADGFGSEPVAYYRNIAVSSSDSDHIKMLEEIYESTWPLYGWNFDKEVYSSWKTDFFINRFDCFCVLRKTGSMFPPKRGMVNHWYDAIYWSAVENHLISHEVGRGLLSRAMKGYEVAKEELLCACQRNSIPVFNIDEIMFANDRRVGEWLLRLPVGDIIDIHTATDDIMENRQYKERTWRDII